MGQGRVHAGGLRCARDTEDCSASTLRSCTRQPSGALGGAKGALPHGRNAESRGPHKAPSWGGCIGQAKAWNWPPQAKPLAGPGAWGVSATQGAEGSAWPFCTEGRGQERMPGGEGADGMGSGATFSGGEPGSPGTEDASAQDLPEGPVLSLGKGTLQVRCRGTEATAPSNGHQIWLLPPLGLPTPSPTDRGRGTQSLGLAPGRGERGGPGSPRDSEEGGREGPSAQAVQSGMDTNGMPRPQEPGGGFTNGTSCHWPLPAFPPASCSWPPSAWGSRAEKPKS